MTKGNGDEVSAFIKGGLGGYMKPRAIAVMAVLVTALFVAAESQKPRAEDDVALLKQALSLFKPLPQTLDTQDLPTTPERVALGRMLFFDPRWTVDGNVSCATCHQPALYGTDALPTSIGVQHCAGASNAGHRWRWGGRRYHTRRAQLRAALVGRPEESRRSGRASPDREVQLGAARLCSGHGEARGDRGLSAALPPSVSWRGPAHHVGKHRKGDRCLRAHAPQPGALRCVLARECAGVAAHGQGRPRAVHEPRLSRVPQRGRYWWPDVPEVWADRRILEGDRKSGDRQGPVRTHEGSCRPVRLQSPEPPKRRHDPALFSRWIGDHARRSGAG